MKKVIIVIISGIIIFVSVSLLMNKCTNDMRKKIENETKEEMQIEETKKYELEVKASEYGLINSDDNWFEYVKYINDNYVDEKFRKFSSIKDVVELFDKGLYRKIANGDYVKKNLMGSAQETIFKILLTPNSEWADLPITENIRKKFNEKDGVLGYYKLPTDLMEKGTFEHEGDNIYKIRREGIYDNSYFESHKEKYSYVEELRKKFPNVPITMKYPDGRYYYFCYMFDENGYFDNIYYLGGIDYYDDSDIHKDVIELNNNEDIKECLLEICSTEDYLLKKEDDNISINEHISKLYDYNINYKYRNKILKEDGILPIKNIIKDSLKVEEYNNNTHKAIVSVEIENKKIYYDIELFIDDKYYLTDTKVELYKEEKK